MPANLSWPGLGMPRSAKIMHQPYVLQNQEKMISLFKIIIKFVKFIEKNVNSAYVV
jgi:hypothetical protein